MMFEIFAVVIILVFIVGMFLVFDNEILRGHFAKKIRKYFGVKE
jgi:hypothetical protein